MRALRNFKPNRCYHLISRIANRAFFLTDEERTRFVNIAIDTENRHSPQRKYRLAVKRMRIVS